MYIHINRRKLAILLGLVAGAALLLGLARGEGAETVTAAGPGRVLAVNTAELAAAPGYERGRRFVGRVEFARSSELAFELGGMLVTIRPEEGDTVEAGQVLASLDTERLRARRAELLAARAEARAQVELETLRSNRFQRLLDQDAIAPQRADDARLGLAARRSVLSRVDAQIRSLDVDLAKSELRAPFAGRVARRHVDEGVVLGAGEPVLRLLETGRPEVRVGVPREVALRLREGQVATLALAGAERAARVRSVLPERRGETRTVSVVLTLDAPDPGLREGDLAELMWSEQVATAGAWLPTSALAEGSRGLWTAYVALPDARPGGVTHRLERRPVELLHQEGERVYVRGALEPGDRVVQDGVHRLVPDQLVRLAAPEARGLAMAGAEEPR